MNFKKNIAKILFISLIIIIFIGTLLDFSFQLQQTLTTETYRTLSKVSIDYNKAFMDNVSYNIKMMKMLSDSFNEIQDCTKEEIVDILQNAANDSGITKIIACNDKGITCSNDATSKNISNEIYFQKAMAGEANTNAPMIATVDGVKSFVMAVPIHTNGEITGLLFGAYPLYTASTNLLDFAYYSDGYGFVTQKDGDIILSNDHTDKLADENNLFSFFNKTEINDYSVAELKKSIQNAESKSFSFTYKGEKRFVSFIPSTVNDWITFSISSDAMMQKQKRITNEIVFKLIFGLCVVGLLLFVWIYSRNKRHNMEILTANKKYASLLSHINGGMIVAIHGEKADDTIVTYVSSGFTDMTGYTLEDIKTIFSGRYLDIIIEEDRYKVFEIYLEQLKVGNSYWMPYRIRKKDGSLIWVMDNGYLVEDAQGCHNHSIISDITGMKQQEDELRMSENRFSVAINASSGTLFEVDLKKQLYTHFENAQRIFGINAEKLLEDTAAFSSLPYDEFVDAVTQYFFHPADYAIAKNVMGDLLEGKKASYEARLRRFDNSYIWAKIDLSLVLDEHGEPFRLVGFMSDIDDIKKKAELLESKIQTDPMTGLYNKIAMSTLSNKILSESTNSLHALIVLDIDNFKGINDTLGHTFGDLVLIEICTKLKIAFRNNDIVGRMGGDEFAVLMKNVPNTASVLKKATELSGDFRQTYTGEKGDYKISCSMGIIMIDSTCEPFETFYKKADCALYSAKQNGKDRFVLYQEKDAENYPIKSTRTNDEEMQNLKTSHNMEAQIFELLYTAKDFNVSINMALAAIGQHYHVSRVSIFENNEYNLTTSNIHEWCNGGVQPKIAELQNLKLSSGEDSILSCFDESGLLYCNDVRELPPYLRQILEFKGVLSTLKVTISNDEKICGFIGFDECREYRIWTAEEIEKLSYLSKVLSVFLFKKKTENALMENLHTRLKILDVLPDYICVINPETHKIEYTNMKMREILPTAKPGVFCFSTLRGGQRAPCEICLMERIKSGDTDNLEILNADKSISLRVNAISINWSKNKKMVLLYGKNIE